MLESTALRETSAFLGKLKRLKTFWPQTWKLFAVSGEQGGLARAEPLQLFGWGGARNVFEPPPQLEESWPAKK